MTNLILSVFCIFSSCSQTPNINQQFITPVYAIQIKKEVKYKCPTWNKDFNPCSCISYLKFRLGIPQSQSLGNAWDIQPNSKVPKVGGIILTNEGRGHAGYVFYVTDEKVMFDEYNFIPGQKSVRTFELNDPRIRGYKIYLDADRHNLPTSSTTRD